MTDGILNIRKEPGFTSFDVVAKLRGILHQKKIGHTGTLDPDAEGVLPVCLGKATKLCSMIDGWKKTYEAVLLLGTETDTEDTSGKVTAMRPVTVTERTIREIMASFVGESVQVPPMYSAKKVHGRKLYELAREGVTIERAPCRICIDSMEVLKVDLPRVTFRVTCSKGTYIRSLCRDIGQKAGCGGCMEHLVRTKVFLFDLESAHTLDEVEQAREAGTIGNLLIPTDRVFSDRTALKVLPQGEKRLKNGNPVPASLCESLKKGTTDGPVRLYDGEGQFIGIYEKTADQMYRPVRLFL